MNTKLYKQVHGLATDLMTAANKDDETAFNGLYDELKTLCLDNEKDEVKNHPVQWETLADFTEDSEIALPYYQKALAYAEAINSHDFMASINYAIAMLYQDEDKLEQALESVKQASVHAKDIGDNELQNEITELLNVLS